MPSLARSRAFRRRRQLPFQLMVPVKKIEGDLHYADSFLTVDYEGIVTMDDVNYAVPWGTERPLARGSYTRSVHSSPVSDAQPTSSDVHNRLSSTFLTLVSHCSVCDVDEAFSDCGSNTIFEVENRFDGNLENRVRLVGVKPGFMKYVVDGYTSRDKYFSRSRSCWTTCSVLFTRPRM